jgi:hypothetical protein
MRLQQGQAAYEDLIEKMLNVLDYGFVQEHYNLHR